MTQQEVIQELKSAVSPLFWEEAIKVKSGAISIINSSGLMHPVIWCWGESGKVSHFNDTAVFITLESAKQHLKLHQSDWERANPEYAREMEWQVRPHIGWHGEILACNYIRFAGYVIEIVKQPTLEAVTNWVILKYGETIKYHEATSFDSAKSAAINALIDHLKGEQL